jgi:uncharacterized repeat protein (TIGR03803 family)
LYGTAYVPTDPPYVYRVTPSGTASTVAVVPDPVPWAFLQASDGNFYGGQSPDGANNTGSIYRLTTSGQLTRIYSFTKGANKYPFTLIQASDGNLYGATAGAGGGPAVLYRLTTSGQYTLLHTFASGDCPCFLMQASDGILYGSALAGGPTGGGFIWALDAGLPIPVPQALSFTPQAGAAGRKVRIWGYNLFHATVQFNGEAATEISNAGPNYLFATVPSGAATGPITVTTPGGTSTTTSSFTVK